MGAWFGRRIGLAGRLIVCCLALGLWLAACGGSKPAQEAPVSQDDAGDSEPGRKDGQGQDTVTFLNMGTTNSASSHYAFGVALQQSIERGTNGRIRVNVVETGATLDNARRIRRGELQFGLCTAEGVYQIYNGTGAWEDEGAYRDYRILFVYVPAPNIIVVRTDAGIETLRDLAGKPFSPGIQGSSGEATTRRMFEALAIEPRWMPGSIDEAVNYMKDGQIVGFAKSASGPTVPDATFLDVSTFLDVKVLGLTDEQLDVLRDKMPDLIPVEVPAGVYPGQDRPLRVPGVVGCYCAPKDFDPSLAYEIIKAIFANKERQDEAFPAVKDLDYVALTMQYSTAPLHAGALRYFREIGADIPEHLVPPEAR